MSAELKYQGQERQQSSFNDILTKQTYVGFENEIDDIVSACISGFNDYYPNKGYLTNWRKSQDEGPFYTVEIQYNTSLNNGSIPHSIGIDDDSIEATLDTRSLQLPLQKKSNYKYKWNHFLLTTLPDVAISGTIYTQILNIWNNATDGLSLSGNLASFFNWADYGAEATQGNSAGNLNRTFKEPTKPGVNYFDEAYFVVTEIQRYSSSSKAGNNVKKSINVLIAPTNTFGLDNSNVKWKLDSSSISYDGKYWVVRSVYTYSISGWDTELYTLGV